MSDIKDLAKQLLILKRQNVTKYADALSIVGKTLADELVEKTEKGDYYESDGLITKARTRVDQTANVIRILETLVAHLEAGGALANMAALGSSGTNPARAVPLRPTGQEIQASLSALVKSQRPTGEGFANYQRLYG